LTPSYLSGTTSPADPAGGFMLPAVFSLKQPPSRRIGVATASAWCGTD